MRNVVIAGVILCSFAPLSAQNRGTPEFEAWKACVAATALRYSKGPDNAEIVVRVALLGCPNERKKLLEEISKDRSMSTSQHYQTLDALAARITNDLLVQVMEARVPK
jgi:hypothetical protein